MSLRIRFQNGNYLGAHAPRFHIRTYIHIYIHVKWLRLMIISSIDIYIYTYISLFLSLRWEWTEARWVVACFRGRVPVTSCKRTVKLPRRLWYTHRCNAILRFWSWSKTMNETRSRDVTNFSNLLARFFLLPLQFWIYSLYVLRYMPVKRLIILYMNINVCIYIYW